MNDAELTVLTILIVDDDEVDRTAVRRALNAGSKTQCAHDQRDIVCIEAVNAEQGLDLLLSNDVDCIFLDFNLPGEDDMWFVRQVRERGLRVPVIVLTGHGDQVTAVELMKAGANDYFAKAMLTTERAMSSMRQALRIVAAETALRESEHRAHLAIEAADLGTWDFYPNTGRLELSDRARAFVGLQAGEEPSFERFVASIHEADRGRVTAAVKRALDKSTGSNYDIEYRTVTFADGSEYWLRATGRALFDRLGHATRFIGTAQDIGDRREFEMHRALLLDAERKMRQQAEAASRMRDDLLAIVSHDLRNPLSAIAVSTELLRAVLTPEVAVRLEKPLSTITRSTDRMTRLISDLLDVASIDAGGLALNKMRVEVSELVQETLDILLPVASDKSVLLLADPIPSLQICADRERILQVLSNLIGNAIKFTEKGGTIVLSAHPEGDCVRLSVADTGCGVPAEQIGRLFDRYWQAKQDGRLGIGLGLSIAKGIVDAHGGKIWAESKLHKGTTFHFELPFN